MKKNKVLRSVVSTYVFPKVHTILYLYISLKIHKKWAFEVNSFFKSRNENIAYPLAIKIFKETEDSGSVSTTE